MSVDLYARQAVLTTHALDIARGCPGAGLGVTLYPGDARMRPAPLASVTLNAEGRCAAPLIAGPDARAGSYVLEFDLAAYFDVPSIFPRARACFHLADPRAHYHVPLILAPGGYSCYRGAPPSRAPRESAVWRVSDPASWPGDGQPSQGTGGGRGPVAARHRHCPGCGRLRTAGAPAMRTRRGPGIRLRDQCGRQDGTLAARRRTARAGGLRTRISSRGLFPQIGFRGGGASLFHDDPDQSPRP